MNSQKYEEILKLAQHQHNTLNRDLLAQKAKYKDASDELELLQKVHIVLEQIESSIRGSFTKVVEDLVSYGRPFSTVESTKKRGQFCFESHPCFSNGRIGRYRNVSRFKPRAV